MTSAVFGDFLGAGRRHLEAAVAAGECEVAALPAVVPSVYHLVTVMCVYLEDLASVTVDVLSSASHPGSAAAPGSDRLTLAMAARTGLAAGLGLLEVTAPKRLLAETYRGAKL